MAHFLRDNASLDAVTERANQIINIIEKDDL